jgi:hypothetical protein
MTAQRDAIEDRLEGGADRCRIDDRRADLERALRACQYLGQAGTSAGGLRIGSGRLSTR